MALNGRTAQLIRVRLGRFSALCMILAALGVIDALSALMQQDFNRFDLIPGEVEPVTGPMPPDTKDISDLRVYLKSGDIKLIPEGVYKGFWFGGQMWKGRLEVAPSAKPGEYRVSVLNENEDPDALVESQPTSKTHPSLSYKLVVWANDNERQHGSNSLIIRHLGIRPFYFALFFVLWGIIIGGISWLWTQKTYRILASENRSTVHMVRKIPEGGIEIAFYVEKDSSNLCRQFEKGHPVTILNSRWQKIAEGKVESCDNKLVKALLISAGMGGKAGRTPGYADIVEY